MGPMLIDQPSAYVRRKSQSLQLLDAISNEKRMYAAVTAHTHLQAE